MAIYQFRAGSRLKGDAAVVATEIERIAGKLGGAVEPEQIVTSAKRKTSVLHTYFEWDDTAAAHEYRLDQARHLIRSIEVVTTDEGETVNKFHSVTVLTPGAEAERRAYVTVERAMSDDELRVQIVRQLYAQAQAFVRQARAFERHAAPFAGVARAIEALPSLRELESGATA
jgi:hypothetical protein